MKANYRKRTRYIGVFERTSKERIHNGKPDICFDVCYKSNGRLVWEKAGWASEGYSSKLAANIRAERIRSIRHGDELPKQKRNIPYFKDVASKYMQWATENKKSSRDDKSRYDKHLAGKFDNKRMNEITSFDLERLKSDLTKEGLAAQTVKHCLVLVRQIFNKAITWGLWDGKNPIKGVKLPTVSNERERFLSHEEADLLLNKLLTVSKQTHDIALLSLHCGLRAGEVLNLRGQDIDFQNELINIADPKSNKPRKAYMTKAVKEMLLQRIPESPDNFIFKDRKHGGKIKEVSRSYFRTVKELKFNKGISDNRQKVTFHTLRHTFASWLALQGESLITIRELLGHKSFAMTQRYTHLIPAEKRRATLKLEKAFELKRNGVSIKEGKA